AFRRDRAVGQFPRAHARVALERNGKQVARTTGPRSTRGRRRPGTRRLWARRVEAHDRTSRTSRRTRAPSRYAEHAILVFGAHRESAPPDLGGDWPATGMAR